MYEFNGEQYSLEDIESLAIENGYNSAEEYLAANEDVIKIEDAEIKSEDPNIAEETPGIGTDFQIGSIEESAVVGPENVAPEDMDLSLETPLLEFQEDVVVEDIEVEVSKEPSFMQKVVNFINNTPSYSAIDAFSNQEFTPAELKLIEEQDIEKTRIEDVEFLKEKDLFTYKIEDLLNEKKVLKEITKSSDNPEGVSNFEFILPQALNGLGNNKDAYESILKVIKPILLEDGDYNGPILEKDIDKLFKNILIKKATLEKARRNVSNNIQAIDLANRDFNKSEDNKNSVENNVHARGVAIDVYQQKELQNFTPKEKNVYNLKTIVDNLKGKKGDTTALIQAQAAYENALNQYGGEDPWVNGDDLKPMFDTDGNVIGTSSDENPTDITTGDLNEASSKLQTTPQQSWEGVRDDNLFQRYTSDKIGENTYDLTIGNSASSIGALKRLGYNTTETFEGKGQVYRNVKLIDIAKIQNFLFQETFILL